MTSAKRVARLPACSAGHIWAEQWNICTSTQSKVCCDYKVVYRNLESRLHCCGFCTLTPHAPVFHSYELNHVKFEKGEAMRVHI